MNIHMNILDSFGNIPEILNNKKVLLRERKRHTARHVASTRCAALSNPDLVPGQGGGIRSQVQGGVGGYPVPGPGWGGGCTCSQVWGVPSPRSRGYPIPGLGEGTPSRPVWGGTLGTPLPRPGMGYPLTGPEMGYPPPPT